MPAILCPQGGSDRHSRVGGRPSRKARCWHIFRAARPPERGYRSLTWACRCAVCSHVNELLHHSWTEKALDICIQHPILWRTRLYFRGLGLQALRAPKGLSVHPLPWIMFLREDTKHPSSWDEAALLLAN